MTTISFSKIGDISDLYICSDSTGYLLNSNNELYSFVNSSTTKIELPAGIEVSDFYFTNFQCGAIIGNKTSIGSIHESTMFGNGFGGILLALMLLFLFRKMILIRPIRFSHYIVPALGVFFLLHSCNNSWQMYKTVNEKQPFITKILSKPQSNYGSHSYPANKQQESYITITKDGGTNWSVYKLPTNFYATAITQMGNNYFVGTFANKNASNTIPYHGDGDIYIFGKDTTFSKVLAQNSDYNKPHSFGIGRGVNGFYCDSTNHVFYVYGSETMPRFPKDELSATPGKISQLSFDLQSNYQIIEVPGNSNVISFSKSNNGTIWIITDNKVPKLVKGYIVFEKIPQKSFYKLVNNATAWESVIINDTLNSFNQVEFIPNTGQGYVIGEKDGQLFETTDSGDHWEPTNIFGVRRVVAFKNKVVLLKESNELVYL